MVSHSPIKPEHPKGAQTPSTVPSPTPAAVLDSTEAGEDDDSSDDLTSLSESVEDHEWENGRRYHGYKPGYYALPNDEQEMDRLDMQHHITKQLLNGDLHRAPLKDPKRILDLGTGSGIWAVEMGEKYPRARVIGTDLSATQPGVLPRNVRFEVDDLESKWLYKKKFDHIHSRFMLGAVRNWEKMLMQAFRSCELGGYVELQELDPHNIKSDDGTDAKAEYWKQYAGMLYTAMRKLRKPVPGSTQFRCMLVDGGFVDVQQHVLKMPMNSWPKDEKLREIGRMRRGHHDEHLEGMSIGYFSRALDWSPDEVQVLLAKVRKELKDPSIHCYQNFTITIGRKPFPVEKLGSRLLDGGKASPKKDLSSPLLAARPVAQAGGPVELPEVSPSTQAKSQLPTGPIS